MSNTPQDTPNGEAVKVNSQEGRELDGSAEAASPALRASEKAEPNPLPWSAHDTGDSRGTVIKSSDGDTVAILMGSVPFTAKEAPRICAIVNSFEALKGALGTVYDILGEAPELNPSNYDHEGVCELNAKVVEAVLFLRAALQSPTLGGNA